MARTKGKVDLNQNEIRDKLEELGYSFLSLAPLGDGAPDALVGSPFNFRNWLFEIKRDNGKLNEKQKKWHSRWKAQVHVIRSTEDALKIMEAK